MPPPLEKKTDILKQPMSASGCINVPVIVEHIYCAVRAVVRRSVSEPRPSETHADTIEKTPRYITICTLYDYIFSLYYT